MLDLKDGLVLYHGSYCEVKDPDLAKCAKRKDFGQEFYLTTSKEQAESFLRTSIAKNQKLLYTHGMGTWKSKNRHKYLLQYHIIFVCKYRKKLLVLRQISDDIKQFSYEICQRHSVIIRYMEKISSIFTKTILERTYLLDRWIFCL